MINVAILSVPLEPQRYSYWPGLLKELAYLEVKYGIKEIPVNWGTGPTQQYETWEQYGLIILPVDTANGASEFGGKIALKYLTDERVNKNLAHWVEAGGVFFCELQCEGGRPKQASYDTIFRGSAPHVVSQENIDRFPLGHSGPYENIQKKGGESSRGSAANVSRQFHAHPACFGIHPGVRSDYSYSGEEVIPGIYREDRTGYFSLFYRCPETLYSGWFIDWPSDWIPLLVESETNRWPVLLVRTQGKGAWIASTMRLTSKAAVPLVRNIVFFSHFRDRWLTYHRQALKRRKRQGVAWICLMAAALTAIILTLVHFYGVGRLFSRVSTLSAIGVSFLAVLAFLWKLAKFLVRRPMGHPRSVSAFFKRVREGKIRGY
jgi:hypothetical protein